MSRPVSIIIPAYNRADKILPSIWSVLHQTHKDFELIIVDDASTDNTADVVHSVHDDRILYHRLAKNAGAGGARNAGVSIASHDIIAFQDSDDIWHPDKLEKQLAYWEQHRDYSMIYAKFHFYENGDDSYDAFAHMGGGNMEGDFYIDLLKRNTIATPTMLIDRDAFFSCGGFDTSWIPETHNYGIRPTLTTPAMPVMV